MFHRFPCRSRVGRTECVRHSIMSTFALLLVCVSVLGCQPPDSNSDGAGEDANSTTTSEETTPVSEDRVLRHAVFFKFKETSSEEEVNEVVEAFRGLPEKIDAITDFAWGTNNSPEGLDDGFTHCFLLTFADEAGRDVYLPHPDHKAFGDVLRPHMEDVFVIDYWGNAAEPTDSRLLKHAVFFKFADDADPAGVKAVEDAFAALPGKIEQIADFEWGTNNSPESHDDGFTHCFMVTFASEDDRAAYLPHPDHQAFVEVLKPVLDKVRVLDFWANP